jgi:hypothetical protein
MLMATPATRVDWAFTVRVIVAHMWTREGFDCHSTTELLKRTHSGWEKRH